MENYTSVCDVCNKKTWYTESQQCHCVYPKRKTCKTCGHSEEIEPLQMERCKGTLRIIDNSDLNAEFTTYYQSQERIEVEYTYGKEKEILRGRVGKTTGWKPCYLLMKTTRSIGSSDLLTKNARFIKVISK